MVVVIGSSVAVVSKAFGIGFMVVVGIVVFTMVAEVVTEVGVGEFSGSANLRPEISAGAGLFSGYL